MEVWVLEFSVKAPQEPIYPMMGAVVFSSQERAMAYLKERGMRVRWKRHANPDVLDGFSRKPDIFWKWVLSKQRVDYFDDDDLFAADDEEAQ